MHNENGNISINTENIFPIIKKWLYSDMDIFVRELVSNGCDAISKFRRLVSIGEANASDDTKYKVKVIFNEEEKHRLT
jgi:molecular chaperone HtpG